MPKTMQAVRTAKKVPARVAELAPKQAVERQLAEVIAELDRLHEGVSAAYAQMALDMIRR